MESEDYNHDIEIGLDGPDPDCPPKLIFSASEPGYNAASPQLPQPELQRHISAPVTSLQPLKPHQPNRHLRNLNLIVSLPLPIFRRRSTSVPVFHCQICMENHVVDISVQAENCSMQHKFCTDMLSGYLTSQINDGMVDLHCPCFGEGCNGKYNDSEVQNLVDEDTFEKFLRFRAIKHNPDYRECPRCNTSVMGCVNTPEIICATCGERYCYFHANAHPNMSCSQFSREQTRRDRQSSALIKRMSRKCPQCQAPTEKNGGCNHMTCQHCGEVRGSGLQRSHSLALVLLSPCLSHTPRPTRINMSNHCRFYRTGAGYVDGTWPITTTTISLTVARGHNSALHPPLLSGQYVLACGIKCGDNFYAYRIISC